MSDKYVAYVGTYTHEKSRGIHIYDMDVEKFGEEVSRLHGLPIALIFRSMW